MQRIKLLYFILIVSMVTLIGLNYQSKMVTNESIIEEFFDFLELTELEPGQYYTMIDDEGNIILQSARIMHVGDQFINNQNRLYEVYEVDRDKLIAKAKYLKDINLAEEPRKSLFQTIVSRFTFTTKEVKTENKGPIAIYHTHSSESYVPTDGTESKDGNGGIYDVGRAFKEALEQRGIEVVWSEANHDPHDSGAYKRSRRTADKLLNKQPAAIFDVHRDAVPAEQYEGEADGEPVAQIMFVVGQQNQNVEQNKRFAEGLKKVADEQNPDLIKGIFMAKGNYNQDLSPRALLLEVGTYQQEKDLAISGIESFVDVVAAYVYGDNPQQSAPGGDGGGNEQAQTPAARDTRNTGGRTILWILGLAALGAVAFLAINSGSLKDVGEKLKNFTTKEFTSTLKGKNKSKKRKK
ncbi:stage II sporulation protein P [Anaerobranca gottschalkii]|uniref:Stage II sporulation protein P n=1 Tax=Anaerobranca gottschalkii DSM 13577 TaxID=1120990 RepID=A0A1H9YDV6_9FIRM|nr:stage II sporulation protein P [Anaerobranca gottschalkii]SES67154.1 stage II sporulation protein P [Anaerobranca gottschalkii DSM 13577]